MLENEGKGKRRNPSTPGPVGITLQKRAVVSFVHLNQGASGSQTTEAIFNVPTVALKSTREQVVLHCTLYQPTFLKLGLRTAVKTDITLGYVTPSLQIALSKSQPLHS